MRVHNVNSNNKADTEKWNEAWEKFSILGIKIDGPHERTVNKWQSKVVIRDLLTPDLHSGLSIQFIFKKQAR